MIKAVHQSLASSVETISALNTGFDTGNLCRPPCVETIRALNTGFDTGNLLRHTVVASNVMDAAAVEKVLGGTLTAPAGRGFHSFTFHLNLSAFCGIGGGFRVVLEGVLRGLHGAIGDV
jgi:hypothetical protein